MTWRLVVLGVLAISLAAGAVLLLAHGVQLQEEASKIYVSNAGNITEQQQARASAIQERANLFTELVPSMFFAAPLAALAIPAVLARRHQLTQRAQQPAR